MKDKRKQLMKQLCILGVVSSLVSVASAYNPSAVDCDIGGGQGYTSIAALNADIQAERDRILGGGDPEDVYSFILCPFRTFDADLPIRPVLDNIVIGCGTSLSSTDPCTLLGGDTQVVLESFDDTEHPVSRVEFSGVTFSQFSQSAVSGPNANDSTMLILRDVIFTEVNSAGAFLIEQQNDDSATNPFKVEVRDSNFAQSTLSGGFANNGGELLIDNFNVTGVEAAGALVSVANGGALQLEDMEVSGGSFQRAISIEGGSQGNIDGLSVSGISALDHIVYVIGTGSRGTVENGNIRDIDITATGEEWVGFQVRQGGTLTVVDSSVSDVAGAQAVFSAIAAEITIDGTNVNNVVGGKVNANTVIASVVEGNDSTVTYRNSRIEAATEFTAGMLMAIGSELDASGICVIDSDLDAVAFLDEESSLVVQNNAVETTSSLVCRDSGIGQDGNPTAGRATFQGDEPSCLRFADYETCAQIVETTSIPTSPPTISPTSVPTVQGSDFPSSVPTDTPSPTTLTPAPTTLTAIPTRLPTGIPTQVPTTTRPTSVSETQAPTGVDETAVPTTVDATAAPTGVDDTAAPTGVDDTAAPTRAPVNIPPITLQPSPVLDPSDSLVPTVLPSELPSQLPTIQATTLAPNATPFPTTETATPTRIPTETPTRVPTTNPTSQPSSGPTRTPSITGRPTAPSFQPTNRPSLRPVSLSPTTSPTGTPTSSPIDQPTVPPSISPTRTPTDKPTGSPINAPTGSPTVEPTRPPSQAPTKCIPRPIYISPRDVSKGKGKGSGRRYLKHSPKSKKSSYKGKGKGKGKGSNYVAPPTQKQVEGPSLPYCDDVFQPIIVHKGKGKGGRKLEVSEDDLAEQRAHLRR